MKVSQPLPGLMRSGTLTWNVFCATLGLQFFLFSCKSRRSCCRCISSSVRRAASFFDPCARVSSATIRPYTHSAPKAWRKANAQARPRLAASIWPIGNKSRQRTLMITLSRPIKLAVNPGLHHVSPRSMCQHTDDRNPATYKQTHRIRYSRLSYWKQIRIRTKASANPINTAAATTELTLLTGACVGLSKANGITRNLRAPWSAKCHDQTDEGN